MLLPMDSVNHVTAAKALSSERPSIHTVCPECGQEGYITVERVCNGTHVATQYLLPRVRSHLEGTCIDFWSCATAAVSIRALSDKHQFSMPGSVLATTICMMAVRLTRKLADMIDGIDLSAFRVGDVLHLPWRSAWMLIAEGWAEMIERRHRPRGIISGLRPRPS